MVFAIPRKTFDRAIGFLRANKIFYLVYCNILAFIVLLYVLVGAPLWNSLSPSSAVITTNQICFAFYFSLCFLFYPLIGKVNSIRARPQQWAFWFFLFLTAFTIVTDLAGIYPGFNNFTTDYNYGRNYFIGEPSTFYYPPMCSLYFVFNYLINPWESTLVYRLFTNIWAVGIYYMVFKIASIKSLGISENKLSNALFFITTNAIQIYLLVFFQKFDFFIIFVTLIGIYTALQQRWFLTALVFTFAGFFKLYSFLWLGAMLLLMLKQKKWDHFKKLLISTVISGAIMLSISIMMEGPKFIENTLRLGWHYTVWEEVFNLNWSYYLKFLGIPGMNYVPFIILAVVILLYLLRYANGINLQFFINLVVIILFVYPSINYHYIIWIVPLIGLNLHDNVKQYRKAIFTYEIVHVNTEMHVFSWLMLLGFENELYMLPGIVPNGIVIILIVKLLLIIPLLLGLRYFLVAKNPVLDSHLSILEKKPDERAHDT